MSGECELVHIDRLNICRCEQGKTEREAAALPTSATAAVEITPRFRRENLALCLNEMAPREGSFAGAKWDGGWT